MRVVRPPSGTIKPPSGAAEPLGAVVELPGDGGRTAILCNRGSQTA
jgi:hypothetical protein